LYGSEGYFLDHLYRFQSHRQGTVFLGKLKGLAKGSLGGSLGPPSEYLCLAIMWRSGSFWLVAIFVVGIHDHARPMQETTDTAGSFGCGGHRYFFRLLVHNDVFKVSREAVILVL